MLREKERRKLKHCVHCAHCVHCGHCARRYFLISLVVPIPYGQGPVAIRDERTVEFQTERHYELGGQNSRVKRRVIGKIDPGMMFPNESYFELIPENPVPAEIQEPKPDENDEQTLK